MATSVESPSPAPINKQRSPSSIAISSLPLFSPSSDKRYWSSLRNHVDTLLENRKPLDRSLTTQKNGDATSHAKRLKEDSMLLLRGFDSVAQSLSQLSNNLQNALQGAKQLAEPPTLTELIHATLQKAKTEENLSKEDSKNEQKEQKHEEDNELDQRAPKRKLDSQESSEDSHNIKEESSNELKKIKRVKNMAISMATKAASMARELKSVKSGLSFMQDQCALLEEENTKLRNGLAEGVPPDEDDLVRLQLEALLAEKSRLASENANLTRENQSLHQLVEYHQLTSQDLSASYEDLVRGMCLDFSSPTEEETVDHRHLRTDIFGFSKSLDECYDEEEQE